MSSPLVWYVVQQPDGHCTLVSRPCPQDEDSPDKPIPSPGPAELPASQEQWGPFPSEAEAIARRVGLIRAGKCKPV